MKNLVLLILLFAAPIFAVPNVQFGLSTDKPVVGDYDGDGKADVAVFRPSEGTWYILGSSRGFYAVQFGQNGDTPIQADWDGDHKTNIAVWRPMQNGSANWFILGATGGYSGFAFGYATDTPMPGDYDGDGRADPAVVRAVNGKLNWLFF